MLKPPSDNSLLILSAIRHAGSFSAAARSLGVAHTTVARRLRELEGHYGARLVERLGDRAILTAEGERAVRTADRIEEELTDLERDIKGSDGRLSGHILLTTVDILAWRYMSRFTRFCEDYPDIELTLSTETEVRSLSRREAEMALRLSNSPEPYLYGRVIDRLAFAPYVHEDVFSRAEGDFSSDTVPWLSYAARECAALCTGWMQTHAPNARIRANLSTPLMMVRAILSGLGAGLLPTAIGDQEAGLTRLESSIAFEMDVWLLAPEELKHTARIRAMFAAFGSASSRPGAGLREAHPRPLTPPRDLPVPD